GRLVEPPAAAAATGPAPMMLSLPSPPAGPPPKSFDAWGPLVQAYNAKLLDGKPRQFPTRRLAGADAVLSRIYHEHTVSKAYTPLLLGEILSARTWTSADELNKLAAGGKEFSGGALHIVAGTVVAAEEKKAWEVRGVMAFLDGLEAVRLAWILTGLGEEADVDAYIAWWDKKARARAVNIEALGHYWTSTATTLAMEMRQRRTFKEVTVDIMSNVSAFLEAMAAPPPRAEPKGKAKPQPPARRELDTAVADRPSPPSPAKEVQGGERQERPETRGKGRKGGGQTKGADKRQDAQWASWSDSSWDGAGAWWSGGDSTGRPGRDIILLSLFDGVGAAPFIVDRDFGRPRLAVSWEDVADLVLDSDPNAEAMVVWCAAPPCQDFSRIAQGAGHQGDRGRLFEESVAFMDEPRATAATGATGPGRGESLGGCSPYAAHAGRPADPGTGPDAVLEFRREWRHDLARIRRDVLARRHSRLVGVGYPAADDLRQDVDLGFDMLGKAARPRDQEHTRALLDELVAETRLDMGVLRQPPLGDCFAALSFAICQLKLGRGEDWRRSGHNATMGASDVPTHHFLGDIVDLVLRAWAEGWDPV
ncbi:POLA2, partial [Symbiodinium sp. KB8]